MNQYSLRPADITNAPIIIDIQKKDGFRHEYYLDGERIKRLVEQGEKFFLFYQNDSPIGMAAVDIDVRTKLHFFSIIQALQRKGLGKKMFDLLLNELKKFSTKHNTMYCYSEPDTPLVHFLKKNGFEEVGFYRNRFSNGMDAVILEKKL